MLASFVLLLFITYSAQAAEPSPPVEIFECGAQLLSLSALRFQFTNPRCNPPEMSPERQRALKALIISTYGLNVSDWNQRTLASKRFEADRSAFSRQQRKLKENELAARRAGQESERIEQHAQRIQKREAEEAAAHERQKAEQVLLVERMARLRSGDIKVATFDDARLLYAPVKNLQLIMLSPLLSPDSAMYAGAAQLDAQEGSSLLRIRATSLNGPVYAFCKITSRTIRVSAEKMRIAGRVQIVGRYIGNQAYETVAGERKLGPLIEVAYIDPN
jgi:hypothetical protein